ncbi:MAG: ATP-binding protein [Candidatus Caldarchaeum sp.]
MSVVSTTDMYRVQEITAVLSSTLKPIVWDVGINDTYTPDGKRADIPPSPAELLHFLRNTKTHLIITNVLLEEQAKSLAPLLASIALDDKIFASGSHVSVIVSDAYMFPETLLRMAIVVSPPISTAEERRQLLQKIAGEVRERFPLPDVGEEIVLASAGLTLKELETATLKSLYTSKSIDVREISKYKEGVLRNLGLELIKPQITFDHIGGYEVLKEYIRQRFCRVLRQPEVAQYYGLSLPRGMILYGLPGTGKTIFSMALAHEVGLPMVRLSPDRLFHGIVGESEKAVRRITKSIEELSPVIVFIDEADQLFTSRAGISTTTDSGVTTRIISGLLEWMGNPDRRAFIIAATNFVERIDSAFLRPGRIDEVVPIFPPDKEARRQILEIHTSRVRKVPVDDSVDFDRLAELTELMTGAEIEKCILDAAASAMIYEKKTVTHEDFVNAIESIETNIGAARQQQIRRMTEVINSIENINRMLLQKITDTMLPDRIKSLIFNL